MTDTTDPTPERPLDEVYDTQRDVEQDPYGAWQAIQTLSAERDAERGWQTIAESNHQMAQSWQACAEIAGAERDKEHARAEAAEAERDALKAELVKTLSAAILDAQIRALETRQLDTPDQIRANALAFLDRHQKGADT